MAGRERVVNTLDAIIEAPIVTSFTNLGFLARKRMQGWSATDDRALESNGGFWHDRRPRSLHRLPSTSRSDTAERRQRLWDWVVGASGSEPE